MRRRWQGWQWSPQKADSNTDTSTYNAKVCWIVWRKVCLLHRLREDLHKYFCIILYIKIAQLTVQLLFETALNFPKNQNWTFKHFKTMNNWYQPKWRNVDLKVSYKMSKITHTSSCWPTNSQKPHRYQNYSCKQKSACEPFYSSESDQKR